MGKTASVRQQGEAGGDCYHASRRDGGGTGNTVSAPAAVSAAVRFCNCLLWVASALAGATRAEPVTAEVPIPVKYEWLSARFPSASASDYLRIAGSAGANGRPVWQSYLLGLDPTSAGSDFRITSFALVDGKPVVGSNVDAARIGSMGYECRVRGAEVPSSGAWSDVTPAHRYFKLVVVPKSSP